MSKDEKKRGKLAVISGFSGAGKGTLMNRLVEEKEGYVLSVSMTTRKPREGEIDKVSYFFVTQEEFLEKLKNGGVLEYNVYNGNYYGTPKEFVDKNLSQGRNVLLEIDVNGGEQILKKYPDAILIFVVTPSADVLEKRLAGRGTERPEVVTERLQVALEEIKKIPEYRYLIVNDDLETAVQEIDSLIQNEPHAPAGQDSRAAFIGRFENDLQRITGRRLDKERKTVLK